MASVSKTSGVRQARVNSTLTYCQLHGLSETFSLLKKLMSSCYLLISCLSCFRKKELDHQGKSSKKQILFQCKENFSFEKPHNVHKMFTQNVSHNDCIHVNIWIMI